LQRLHTRNLNRACIVREVVLGLDDAHIVDAMLIEPLDGLIDQRQCRYGEDRASTAIADVAGDRSRDDRFAVPSRRLHHDAAAAGLDGLVDLVDQIALLWTE